MVRAALGYTLVEPCCGSAAFTLHLLGAKRSPLAYQGSKWRCRRGLEEKAKELGFIGPPRQVVLTDPGPWGRALAVILCKVGREALLAQLTELAETDPKEVFTRLRGRAVPEDETCFAAEFLFLQRLAFSGKAVGVREGRWVTPGFNKTSAYGTEATGRFGRVKPMIPGLLWSLRGYDKDLQATEVSVQCTPAELPSSIEGPTLVYLDPPYMGSTKYPNGQMTRDEVVALALGWAELGATVMVSEQHALDLPGWTRECLSKGRKDTSPFRGKQQEWLTCWAKE